MSEPEKILCYCDRAWTERDSPLKWTTDDFDATFKEAGYHNTDTIGLEHGGWWAEIYTNLEGTNWLFDITSGGKTTLVLVERWQDYIDFRAHISSSMMPGLWPNER